MKKVIKSDFVKNLKEKFGFTEVDSKLIIKDFFDYISESLVNDKQVHLSGVGILRAKTVPSRSIKIPTLSKIYKVPVRKKIKFTASNVITKKIN